MKTKSTPIGLLIAALMVLFLFSGCYQTYHTSGSSRISDFPTPPHNYRLELFFPGEQPAESDYIKTHVFEVYGYSGTSYAELVRQLKNKAMGENVDAVIVFQKEEDIYAERAILSGLGIKYKSNVDYLSQYRLVDQLYIFDSEKDEYVQVANLYPGFDNQIFSMESVGEDSNGKVLYDRYIKKFSLPFLLEDKRSDWKFTYNRTTGKLSKRTYNNVHTGQRITVRPVYDQYGTVTAIETRHSSPGLIPERYTITISYNEDGNYSEKLVILNEGRPVLKEYYYYDERGKIIQSLIYSISGQKEQPFLKINYFYYEDEDIYTYF